MGQLFDKMCQQKPKDELLYEVAISGNVEAVRTLRREGAGLEWIDREGKTALIVACMSPALTDVAKVLLELGANVNAYRPGRNAGTPLHHAAKRGLQETVKLLLSRGANALVRNDDCRTSLEVARNRGQTDIVRTIENHICKFMGVVREFSGPDFLGGLVSQFLSKKIWVVVVPCGSGNTLRPLRFELAIYSSVQDAMPRTVIALWNAKIEELKFQKSDPLLVIFDPSTKTRHKFASGYEGDKEQVILLYDACRCREISQVVDISELHDAQTLGTHGMDSAFGHSPRPSSVHTQNSGATNSNGLEHHAAGETYNGWGPVGGSGHLESTKSDWSNEPAKEDYNGWGTSDSKPHRAHLQSQHTQLQPELTVDTFSASTSAVPSAPPIPDDFSGEGPMHCPSVDGGDPSRSPQHDQKDHVGSSCIICWELPVEGACVPCGHMAGCMSCLNEIKANKGLCPVCRTKIDQVIRLFVV